MSNPTAKELKTPSFSNEEKETTSLRTFTAVFEGNLIQIQAETQEEAQKQTDAIISKMKSKNEEITK